MLRDRRTRTDFTQKKDPTDGRVRIFPVQKSATRTAAATTTATKRKRWEIAKSIDIIRIQGKYNPLNSLRGNINTHSYNVTSNTHHTHRLQSCCARYHARLPYFRCPHDLVVYHHFVGTYARVLLFCSKVGQEVILPVIFVCIVNGISFKKK